VAAELLFVVANKNTVIANRVYKLMSTLVKAKFHYSILVTDSSEAGLRPAASWNLACHLAC